ncbi:MAG: DNA mismatch repair protein MutS, partial [Prevotella sp.]|nr:DNA mismatch repair protein MutS [Prevotella sp.]
MAKKDGELTPMMKQFFDLKAKHPDALLLFRCGDFYETYCDDATDAAQILGITLTRRNNGAAKGDAMAGFPHHALDTYLPKLIRAGRRVAICDQLEDPKLTKKLVKRGITELVTPGVAMQDNVLNYKENNFLCAIHYGKTA